MRWYALLLTLLLCRAYPLDLAEEDSTLYHNVDVITGQVVMGFEDLIVKGPSPLSINRTYNSAKALERYVKQPSTFKNLKKENPWQLDGGWDIMPHLTMILVARTDCPYGIGDINIPITDNYRYVHKTSCYTAHIPERDGQIVTYLCSDSHKLNKYVLKPVKYRSRQHSLSHPFDDIGQNRVKISSGEIVLKLPNGAKRIYEGKCGFFKEAVYCKLIREVLPNKHQIIYHYTKNNKLESIELKNPKGNLIYATISFSDHPSQTKEILTIATNLNERIEYHLKTIDARNYLTKVDGSAKPKELFQYNKRRESIGAHIQSVWCEGDNHFLVDFYEPTKDEDKLYRKHPEKKPYSLDKVNHIYLPDPKTGNPKLLATLYYTEGETKIVDQKGKTTYYSHKNNHLNKIDYYDENDLLVGTTEFVWQRRYDRTQLLEKTLKDHSGTPLLTYFYEYDTNDHIKAEKVVDHKTEHSQTTLYQFDPKNHQLLKETNDTGLSVVYTYHHKFDKPIKKLTLLDDQIIAREFHLYDWNHLLIESIIDDGTAEERENLNGVTQRHITRQIIDDPTGLVSEMHKSALDIKEGRERLIEKQVYTYHPNRTLATLSHYDSNNTLAYTLNYRYNEAGKRIFSTTPSGRTETAKYDRKNRLIEKKEVGSALVALTYDRAGYVNSVTSGEKTIHMDYNVFGELITQTNDLGHQTQQTFDAFSRHNSTVLTTTLDENGLLYSPILRFTHDLQGNEITAVNPKKQSTHTIYDAQKRPIETIYADKSSTKTQYSADGTVALMIDEEGVTTSFTYDHFQRPLTKTIRDVDGAVLGQEQWEYSTFHLLSHTDLTGLTTHFTYDPLGRLIKEQQEERFTTYQYDSLGNLQKTTKGESSFVQKVNLEKEVTEEWTEDIYGVRENHFLYSYDQEGRKILATREHEKEVASDFYEYDEDFRLIKHTNAQGAETNWIYTETKDSIGNRVEQTIEIDPSGVKTLSTKDSQGRLAEVEIQDLDSHPISKENLVYDRAGNLAKRITTIYDDTTPRTTHTTLWTHSPRGYLLFECEQMQKTTQFTYDKKGRLITKTLPDGTSIHYSYDGLDRLIALKTPAIEYSYVFDKGLFPIKAHDATNQLTWCRSYNQFGELVEEVNPNGCTIQWAYDNTGRRTTLSLPDKSTIHYQYTPLHMQAVDRYDNQGNLTYRHTYNSFDTFGHVSSETTIYHDTLRTERNPLDSIIAITSPYHTHTLNYDHKGRLTKESNSLFTTKNYLYDSLNQLAREGQNTYHFDSFGIPQTAKTNSLCQVVASQDRRYSYTPNGETLSCKTPNDTITYGYDDLGRLTQFKNNFQEVTYTYDPFNRLYQKETTTFGYFTNSTDTKFYLNDKDTLIGTLSSQNEITELKVQGLGIYGDIGSTIAIELDKIYAPLHDTKGNVIALIAQDHTLHELWEPDAFGTNLSLPSKNPWRFQSKRQEGELVFFGVRFYDPTAGRWLTPDPASSLESNNLYLFLQNNPTNRLDLLGYASCWTSTTPIAGYENTFACRYMTDVGSFKGYIYSNQIDKLKFTDIEIKKGQFNLFEKFDQLMPTSGSCISTILHVNGIQNDYTKDLLPNFASLVSETTQDTLMMSLYSKKKPIGTDILTGLFEKQGNFTKSSAGYSEVLSDVMNSMYKINPELLLLEIPHSRGNAIVHSATMQLSKETMRLGQQMRLGIGVAPLMPLAKNYFANAINFYSENDLITKRFGLKYINQTEKYDIRMLPSNLDKNSKFNEHSFTSKTCQDAMQGFIYQYDKRYEFQKNFR